VAHARCRCGLLLGFLVPRTKAPATAAAGKGVLVSLLGALSMLTLFVGFRSCSARVASPWGSAGAAVTGITSASWR
jgi:hypothetical protein